MGKINTKLLTVKIHEDSRKIIAICDTKLVGKKFTDGELQLELNEHFYEGKQMDVVDVAYLINSLQKETPSYNIVGEESVKVCLSEDLIDQDGIKNIAGIPHAMLF